MSKKRANPRKVLNVSVDFRDARGRFAAPSRASSFIVKIAGLKLDFNLPVGRNRLKKKELEHYVLETVDELQRSLVPPSYEKIEKPRLKQPKKTAKKTETKVSFKVEKYEDEFYMRKERKIKKRIRFYFWFKPPYSITRETTREIITQVYNFIYEQADIIIKKYKFYGWRFQINILGGGEYKRRDPRRLGNQVVKDLFGFSTDSEVILRRRNWLKKDVQFNLDTFIESVLSPTNPVNSYFVRLTTAHLEKNDYDRVLFIHGAKLTFIK